MTNVAEHFQQRSLTGAKPTPVDPHPRLEGNAPRRDQMPIRNRQLDARRNLCRKPKDMGGAETSGIAPTATDRLSHDNRIRGNLPEHRVPRNIVDPLAGSPDLAA